MCVNMERVLASERSALEAFVVVDGVVADELDLRHARGHFESGGRIDFVVGRLIIAMSHTTRRRGEMP